MTSFLRASRAAPRPEASAFARPGPEKDRDDPPVAQHLGALGRQRVGLEPYLHQEVHDLLPGLRVGVGQPPAEDLEGGAVEPLGRSWW
ncbi:MAG: hypothetical protein MZV70_46985 [Desulfobacterales bacterium]|nr:hypothetical protein [Desulfobacterales bacterium]